MTEIKSESFTIKIPRTLLNSIDTCARIDYRTRTNFIRHALIKLMTENYGFNEEQAHYTTKKLAKRTNNH